MLYCLPETHFFLFPNTNAEQSINEPLKNSFKIITIKVVVVVVVIIIIISSSTSHSSSRHPL